MNGRGNGHRSLVPDRAAVAKWCICALAAIATILVIDFGGIPFNYRVGQTVQRDIRAKISFSKVNETRTARKRDQAAEAVPSIYTNDSRVIEQLVTAVDSLFDAIAGAESLEQVPAAITTEWPLTPETFIVLRAGWPDANALREASRAIHQELVAVERRGILDLESGNHRPEGPSIGVLGPDGETTNFELGEVLRPSQMDVAGPLAQGLVRALNSKELGELVFRILLPRLEKLPGTLKYEPTDTEAARQVARESVADERDAFEVGDRLVQQDQAFSDEKIALLKAEHEAWVLSKQGQLARLRRSGSLVPLVLGLYALAIYYVGRFERRLAASLSRVALLGALVVVTVGLAKRLHGDLPHGETIAIALAAMTLAIVYSQQFALLVSFGMGLICAWMFGTGVNDFVVLTGGTAAAVLALNRVRSRTKLISVGATAAVTYFVLTWATGLLAAQQIQMLLWDALLRALWGIMAGFLMGGSLPFMEKLFGIVTDINLLELSDVSHPLLLDLMRKAPGTYNHSVTVATLAEAAAEQIGANSLVCRVGSYFHDVGKMLKPHYFIENQSNSVNRHETLNPAMSTLIIIGHVKDGANLAHEHSLPQTIIDLIEQHHGTTLVEYFYQEAAREVLEDTEKEADVEESAFRYPGPKPQSREACILMLADAVESASRTLSEPTPGRIEGLVHELTLKRLLDGQFDECSITLQEISLIKESLIKSVNAIYHGRVKYPEQRAATA